MFPDLPEPESIPLPEFVPAADSGTILDPITVLTAAAMALITAAAVTILVGHRWRAGSVSDRSALARILGVGAGLPLGCWWLGLWPRWPPSEDLGRFLLLLWPGTIVVATLAVFTGRARWLAWLLRGLLAAAAAPLLLHGTSYVPGAQVAAAGGPSAWQATLILGGLIAGFLIAWFLLSRLAERTPSRAPPLALALTCAGAGLAVMLSGNITDGVLGFPLAAALLGTAGPGGRGQEIAPGIVGLFALLVMGHFFAELTLAKAIILLAAPLLGWLAESPWLAALRPWARETLRLMFVAVPVAAVVISAWFSTS